MRKIKVGDTVKNMDGTRFSNNELTATVESVSLDYRTVRLKETDTTTFICNVKLARPKILEIYEEQLELAQKQKIAAIEEIKEIEETLLKKKDERSNIEDKIYHLKNIIDCEENLYEV